MKTMCPPKYHHNGIVVTHPFGLVFMIIRIDIFIYMYYIRI